MIMHNMYLFMHFLTIVIKAKILKREGDNRNSMDIAYTVKIIQDYTVIKDSAFLFAN